MTDYTGYQDTHLVSLNQAKYLLLNVSFKSYISNQQKYQFSILFSKVILNDSDQFQIEFNIKHYFVNQRKGNNNYIR